MTSPMIVIGQLVTYKGLVGIYDLLNALQFHNSFVYQGGPQFSWNNGQKGKGKLACKS
jgi:hypothetical protein